MTSAEATGGTAIALPSWPRPFIAFEQGDPIWKADVLGHSRERIAADGTPIAVSRLGPKGCFVTSLAMATNLRPTVINPRRVNQIARDGGGFVSGTGSLILERAAAAVGLVAPERERIRTLDMKVEADVAAFNDTVGRALDGGIFDGRGFAIVNVDHTRDGNPDHFIIIVGRRPDGDFDAVDPASGFAIVMPRTGVARSVWPGRLGPVAKELHVWGVAPVGVTLAR